MHAYNPHAYTPASLAEWIGIAERQTAKNQILIPRIARYLKPGPVLELGSATGHIAQILQSLGHSVVTSDFAQFFVDYMIEKGLDAHRIDATEISQSGIGRFPNIFCQSITPFITDDFSVVAKSYRSVRSALLPEGRLVLIHAMARRKQLQATMRAHEDLARQAGFSEVALRRDQLLPSRAYAMAPWLARYVEAAFAPMFGSRFVLTARR